MTPLEGTESANSGKDGTLKGRLRYTHDAMIDLVIQNPAITQREVALAFGLSEPWVSRVFCSDAFQARLAQRRTELIDPTLVASLEERLKGVAMQSLTILEEKLEKIRNPELAIKTLDLTTKALGYGARPQNVAIQQNFVAVVPAKAASEDAWAAAHRGGQQVIEAPTVEIKEI